MMNFEEAMKNPASTFGTPEALEASTRKQARMRSACGA